jgi:hypothetical protein
VNVEDHIKEQLLAAFAGEPETWSVLTGEGNLSLDQFLAEESIPALPCAFITFGNCTGDPDAHDERGRYTKYEETVELYLLADGPMRSRVARLREHFNQMSGIPRRFEDVDGKRMLSLESADTSRLQREGYRATQITFRVT